ncbi:MAG: SgcJ/EcaC family oxidoreductase [Saprospiraceae bacterium]
MAIHQIVQDMQDGWNAKSGERFAAHFADDHDYIVWNGTTHTATGRSTPKVTKVCTTVLYETMDSWLKSDCKVRFVKPDVAMTHVFVNNAYDGTTGPLSTIHHHHDDD